VSIDALTERMASMLGPMEEAGDARRFFHATYLRTTRAVRDALRARLFSDPEWVERWDVAFADLYLDALSTDAEGGAVSRPWAVAIRAAREQPSAPALRHVLLGMNAHINYDLPQALLAVISGAEFADPAVIARRRFGVRLPGGAGHVPSGAPSPTATPGRLRSFDPVRVADLEYRARVGYYLRDWPGVLRASIGLVRAGFGMDWVRTLHGAWLMLRANQLWAPADNDPDGARRCMRRFYGLLKISYGEPRDVAEAARLEVDWWRVHRQRQHDAQPIDGDPADELVVALTRLYTFLYDEPEEAVRPAAVYRTEAMDLSDRWVAEGCRPDSPLLAREHAALVRSYAALLAAVHH